MEFGYFCSGVIKTVCPTSKNGEGDPTLACVNGEIQSAIGQGLDEGKLTPWYPATIYSLHTTVAAIATIVSIIVHHHCRDLHFLIPTLPAPLPIQIIMTISFLSLL
jgi:hypothetical protein